jgi:hypothetical protein
MILVIEKDLKKGKGVLLEQNNAEKSQGKVKKTTSGA